MKQLLEHHKGLISIQKSEGWTFHISHEFANRSKTPIVLKRSSAELLHIAGPFRRRVHAITWQ